MRIPLPSLAAAATAAAVLTAALALGACGQKAPEMVAADAAPDQLPPGATAPVKAAQAEAFALPQDHPSRGGAPPSSL